jgi:tetratricopeptide (TPR) repeat protein
MARDLETDQATLRRVLAHAQSRDFAGAAALAEQTLADGFEHPLLLNVLATRLEQQGRLPEALRLLERAVAIAPRDVPARNALALCLQRLERPVEALWHAEELLKRDPCLGFAHAIKGNCLVAMGYLGRARQSHLRAVELAPGNVAAAAALASIATHRGEHDDARRWAQQVLLINPGLPDAVMSLAAAELAAGALQRAETLLQGVIMDSRAGALDKARATGLLGDVLDAAGRDAEAFDAYTTGNEALRGIHRRFAAETSVSRYARELCAAVARIPAARWSTLPAATTATVGEKAAGTACGHVFMVGFPRSGTTLLEVVLDGHPQVVSSEENEWLTDAVMRYLCEPLDLEPLSTASAGDLEGLRAAYWEGIRRAGFDVSGKVFIDKHPLHTLKLPLIARLFPRAKVLFAVRDPRDIVLSCFRRRFKMNAAMFELLTLDGAAALYDAVMTFAEQVRPLLGLDWRVVRHESLVADLDAEIRGICGFLGLPWVAGMDDFAQRAGRREHATPSTAQLSGGLDRSGIGHWRRYAAQLQPVMPTLAPWIRHFGYPD